MDSPVLKYRDKDWLSQSLNASTNEAALRKGVRDNGAAGVLQFDVGILREHWRIASMPA